MLEAREINETLMLFHYIPNKALAIVGVAIFALFAIYLTVRVYWSKSRNFLYILPITAAMECCGYLLRYLCSDYTDLGRYIATTLFLLLPPNALALVNYKALGEVIRLSNVQTNRFYLRPKFVTWFFFSSDIFAFFLQGSGGGLQTISSAYNIGIAVTLVGLVIQLIFFGCFALITIHVNRNPDYNYRVEGQTNPKRNLMLCLYITLAFLYVRSIYRVAEYAAGFDGPIARLEWAFYVFDGLAITHSFIAYSVYFIGNCLPKRNAGDEYSATKTALSSTSLDNLNHAENGIEMHTNNNKYTTSNF